MIFTHLPFYIVILSMIGTVLNLKKDWRGFIFWAVANTGLVYNNYRIGQYEQAFMFAIYLVLAVWGLFDWRRSAMNAVATADLAGKAEC